MVVRTYGLTFERANREDSEATVVNIHGRSYSLKLTGDESTLDSKQKTQLALIAREILTAHPKTKLLEFTVSRRI